MTRGFTLIETIVTVTMFAIVFSAMMFVIQYFYRTNAYVFEQTKAVESAHIGIINSMRDLREASYGEDGAYPIVSATDSSVTFYVDLKGDDVVDRVQYYLSGTTLYRSITIPTGVPPVYSDTPDITDTVATYVRTDTSTPIFRYYDSAGTELYSPVNITDITSINTTITVNLNPARAPEDFTLSAGAKLRNISAQ